MNRNIIVEKSYRPPAEEHNIEIVERKGVGHPDTLADGISEAVSRSLSEEYLERFDNILHHNTDKVLIVGGSAEPEFGKGEIQDPIYVVVAGRGTDKVGDEEIPINEISVDAAREYMDNSVRFLDMENHVNIESRIGCGSVDLKNIFESQGVPPANDTSIGIGYAPLSETERLALETEKVLNSREFKDDYPAVGEDVKVMVQREDSKIDLTVAIAMVSSFVNGLDHYISLKEEISEEVLELSSGITEKEVDVNVNTADEPEKGVVYQTVTGTSAEQGDDGMTGRGNRVNGLITFDRPMSLEAAAGKNPVNHVGKLYNVLSEEVAEDISDLDGVKEVFVRTLSQIGASIDQPKVLNVRLVTEEGYSTDDFKTSSESIAEEHLDNISNLSERIVKGEVQVY